jgi:Protein of unknown function (DUF2946)
MRWFRRNVRFGSWCALVALAVQLVLSFGHLHIATSGVAATALASAESFSGAPEDSPTPSKHSRVADYCTICASIHLAGLLTTEPSSVLAPHSSGAVRLTARIEATPSAHFGLPFSARAPPLA